MSFQNGLVLTMAMPESYVDAFKTKFRGHEGWKSCTLDNGEIPTSTLTNTDLYKFTFQRHDMFSLPYDYSEQETPIRDVMGVIEEMKQGESITLFARLEPLDRLKWKRAADYAWQQWKKGDMVYRAGFDPMRLARNAYALGEVGFNGVHSLITDTLGAVKNQFFKPDGDFQKREQPKRTNYDREELLVNGDLSNRTKQKRNLPVFKTSIRFLVTSPDPVRREMLARSLASAYEHTEKQERWKDNVLVASKVKMNTKKEMANLNEWKIHDLDPCMMSVDEAGKLFQLPNAALQEEFKDFLDTQQNQDTYLDPTLTTGGILLGEVTHKGVAHKLYQPLPPVSTPWKESDWDSPMQTRVAIGPPGSGKSTIGTNFIVEVARYGLGSIYIDPAKGIVGDDAQKVLPNVKRFNLAKVAYGLDWCEAKHAGKAFKDVLADAVTAFFDDGAGAQTNRFLEAAIHGMTTTKLREISTVLRNKEARKRAIESMPVGNIHREDLEEYDGYSPDRQRQIAAPIFNRLNIVLGNSWLSECMNSDKSIDLVVEMSKPQTIIFDVLASDGLTPKQIDILVNLISTKLMLAMKLRKEKDQIPYWIIFDEPHQMGKSTAIWESAVVEARKWRMSYIFLFHEWMQLPDKLRAIVKSVQPHYHLYAGTSKRIWMDLKEEIHPIEVEEAMRMAKYHAVNVIQTENGAHPIIAHMANKPKVKHPQP